MDAILIDSASEEFQPGILVCSIVAWREIFRTRDYIAYRSKIYFQSYYYIFFSFDTVHIMRVYFVTFSYRIVRISGCKDHKRVAVAAKWPQLRISARTIHRIDAIAAMEKKAEYNIHHE